MSRPPLCGRLFFPRLEVKETRGHKPDSFTQGPFYTLPFDYQTRILT